MSIDSAASIFQTVNTIHQQLTRGLTISLENDHTHYHLRNMEYWSATDCFNAPTISIGPGKWGIGAFRSKVTCGTRGILCYEFVLDEWKLKNRLFILIVWDVPLIGDNTYFLHVAHVDSPDFPQKESERRKIFELLEKSQIKAGTNTISVRVNPEVEDNGATGEDKVKPPTSLFVCATMATSAIANIKVEISPHSEPKTNEMEIPLLILIPEEKFSFTKYMEDRFQNAENIVNNALIKVVGIKNEPNSKNRQREIKLY